VLLVPVGWAVGLAVWVTLVAFAVRPLSLPKEEGYACHRPSYDEVRAQRFYDWHNCNPIKVLLSHCEEGTKRAIAPFEIGKEYLQALDHSWRDRMRKGNYHTETYCSTGPNEDPSLQCVQNLQLPEVENFVFRPLDTVVGLMTSRPSGSNAERITTPDRSQKRTPSGTSRGRARNVHSARSPPTRSTPKGQDAAEAAATADEQGAAPATASANGADSGAGPVSCQTPRQTCESASVISDNGTGLLVIDTAMGVEGFDNSPSTRGYGQYL